MSGRKFSTSSWLRAGAIARLTSTTFRRSRHIKNVLEYFGRGYKERLGDILVKQTPSSRCSLLLFTEKKAIVINAK